MPSTREAVRLACRIQAAIAKRFRHSSDEHQAQWRRQDQLFQEVQHQRRLLETARTRGWQHAAAEKQRDLAQAMLACESGLSRLREQKLDSTIPPISDLFAELRCLQAEFETVLINTEEAFLTIQTGAIVLNGIDLGPFLVKLAWPRLAARCDIDCFEIIAVDPRPAGTDETVTHPHVRDHRLCAGDAAIPAQRALEQGRLADAFSLVNGVLHHYNSSSVYVALEDWNGATCWSCGTVTSDDDRYLCDRCEHDVCSECIASCKLCDRYACTSCQNRCAVCGDSCCSGCLESSASGPLSCCADCLTVCVGCEESFGSSEIDQSSGLCPACRAEAKEEGPALKAVPQPIITT